MPKTDLPILNYLFEAGQLKQVKRSGWWLAKVKDPESVAEHSFRTGIVAFVLAQMEGADPHKLCSAGVFHDMCETRTLDLHKVANRYIEGIDAGEQKAYLDQIAGLPSNLKSSIASITIELSKKEKIILKDADLLECALQAKEYVELGHSGAQDWIDGIGPRLKTESARGLFALLPSSRSSQWWANLKKLD